MNYRSDYTQLNKDIIKLCKMYLRRSKLNDDTFYTWLENVYKPTFRELHDSIEDYSKLSKKAFMFMYQINLSVRAVSLHQFAITLNIK